MESVLIERIVVCRRLATLAGRDVSDREVFAIKIQLTSTGKRPSGDRSYGDGGGRCTGVADMKVGGGQPVPPRDSENEPNRVGKLRARDGAHGGSKCAARTQPTIHEQVFYHTPTIVVFRPLL